MVQALGRNGYIAGLLCSRTVIAAGDDTCCNGSKVTAFSTEASPNFCHTDKGVIPPETLTDLGGT